MHCPDAVSQVCVQGRILQRAVSRLVNLQLASAFTKWFEVSEAMRAAKDAAEAAKLASERASEWAPDAWLMGPDFTYGGDNAARQFMGVVEIGREDLTELQPAPQEAVEWDQTGLQDSHHSASYDQLDWSQPIESPQMAPTSDLDATELLRQRMETMNAMFDEVEDMTLDLEREMFQPTQFTQQLSVRQDARPTAATVRVPKRPSKKPTNISDGRWPPPL